MFILRTIVKWGWSPILISGLAVVSVIYEWPIEVVAPSVGVILVIGLVVAVVSVRERQAEAAALRLRQLAGYFNRRFTGNSPLSIFAAIDSLFGIENPQLWEWARACSMSQRIFDTWCNSFIDRVESDIKMRRYDIYLRAYVNELWLLNNHYYEFIQQFFEIAEKIEIPQEALDQYNRFAVEYNTYVQNFQDSIAELKKTSNTEIEPPSVKLAKELSVGKVI
ncbi:hypothetical protein ACFLUR_02970 [Chloroflexota bacterium]